MINAGVVDTLVLGPIRGVFALVALAMFAVKMWALVDAAIRPAPAYVAAGKQTKVFWVVVTAVSVFLGGLSLFGIIAMVAAIVYLVDVRPDRCVHQRPHAADGPEDKRVHDASVDHVCLQKSRTGQCRPLLRAGRRGGAAAVCRSGTAGSGGPDLGPSAGGTARLRRRTGSGGPLAPRGGGRGSGLRRFGHLGCQQRSCLVGRRRAGLVRQRRRRRQVR